MARSVIKKLQEPKWILLAGIKSSDLMADTYNNVTLAQNINSFSLLRISTSYYTSGLPDYGGITTSTLELKAFSAEYIVVTNALDFYFTVKYVNDITLAVKFFGDASATKCLSIHGIL